MTTSTLKAVVAALRDTAAKADEKVEVTPHREPGIDDGFYNPHRAPPQPYTVERFDRAWITGRLVGMADMIEAMALDPQPGLVPIVGATEPPGVLCYVAHGRAWFTTAPLDKQWGDDWDDAPYEHNAGSPYREQGHTLTAVPFDPGNLLTPDDSVSNSRWSVKDINNRGVPWLRSDTAKLWAGAIFCEFLQVVRAAGGDIYTSWSKEEGP